MKDTSILTNNGINVQQSLELFGDMEMYDETLGDFLDMSDEKISTLENYKNANDMPNYAIAVHALKSDAKYLGFTTLADLSYESEMKSKAGDSVFVAENHPKILQEAKRVINLSQQYMGREVTTVIPESSVQAAPAVEAAPVEAAPVMQTVPVAEQPVAQPVAQVVEQVAAAPAVDPMQQQVVMQTSPVVEAVQPQVEISFMNTTPVEPVTEVVPTTPAPVVETAPVAEVAPVQEVAAQPVAQPVQAQQEVQINFSNAAEPAAPNQVVQPSQPTVTVMSEVTTPVVTQTAPTEPAIQFFPADNYQHQDIMSQALSMQEQAIQDVPAAVKQGIILVVDDSPLVSNFVKKIFSKNYEVLIASDGQKAIELINDDNIRSRIKTCLLDLNMPNVSGFDVMDHFREKGFFVKTPVAIISGAEDAETLDKAKSYPIIDVLPKPFNERDVQRIVEKCLACYF